jgi:predicted small lipoprotein YifL
LILGKGMQMRTPAALLVLSFTLAGCAHQGPVLARQPGNAAVEAVVESEAARQAAAQAVAAGATVDQALDRSAKVGPKP